MFFPILLSFLQICFIPGFIVYVLLNRKAIDSMPLLLPVFTFGLSQILNFIFVFSLTYFHLYTRLSLVLLLISEFIILAGIFIIHGFNFHSLSLKKAFTEIIDEVRFIVKTHKTPYDIIKILLLILSVLLLLSLFNVLVSNAGQIFNSSDAVFSWNRWATDFYHNRMPLSTYHYPQLIPANWSIAYVMCGYPLQFIPKTIMPLFLILPIYAFIFSGIKQRSPFLFISALLVYLGLRGDGFFWTDGFVDVAVTYFGIMVFVSLNLLKKEDNIFDKRKFVFLSAVFVCGAAATKQAGLFIIVTYPLLLFILAGNKIEWTFKKIFQFCLLIVALLIMIVLPYYLWAHYEILKGNAASEIAAVTQEIFKGASYSQRFSNACNLAFNLFSNRLFFVFWIIFFLLSFADKKFRLLNLFFTLPYFLIWSLFFSYSIRNVALAVPYFALSIGCGIDLVLKKVNKPIELDHIYESKKKIFSISHKWILILFLFCISAGIILFNKEVNVDRLIKSQDFRLKQLGEEEVNQKIFLYNTENKINKLIITDYHYLKLMPEIGKYFEYGDIKSMDSTNTNFNNESIGFLLWNPWYSDPKKFPEFIESRIKSGSYKEIFNYKGFRFIKIR